MKLSHVNDKGEARMVDISAKPAVRRTASARAKISLQPETVALVRDQLIEKGDALGVERAIGSAVWHYLSRAAVGHYFDFEAVALYVLRWDVIHRWTVYDGEEAQKRFNEMLEEGLGVWRATATAPASSPIN